MRFKNKFKKLLVVALTAGITVNSIPLSSYAATISQPGSDLRVILEELEETAASGQQPDSGEGTGGETGNPETDAEKTAGPENGIGTEESAGTDANGETEGNSGSENETGDRKSVV